MMVNSLDLSTLVSQIPETQKVHSIQQLHPEAQQLAAQELMLKKQKHEQKQIAKPEHSTSKANVDEKDGGTTEQEYSHSGKKREKRPDDFDTSSGHILDMDV